MNVLGQIPHRPINDLVGCILLAVCCCLISYGGSASGQEASFDSSPNIKPLDEQQRELGRIDDALRSGIQQIERACKPFIEEDDLQKVELKPDTYLKLNQARSTIEAKSNEVYLKFKNAQNVASLKNSKICNSKTKTQPSDSCLGLMLAQEKLRELEAYFQKTTTKNIQIFDNFIVVGKLEALNCVRLGFTDNLIQSYLQRVDETDISGLKYYQSKLDQLKSEIQDHE